MTALPITDALPDPLVPENVDLTDFDYMPLDIVRLFNSSFHARSTDSEWRAGVTLWARSFHQVPPASLPNDEIELTRLAELGRDRNTWRKVAVGAMRGWILCSDDRFYHPVVAEKALEGWLEKLSARKSSGAGNKKRWGHEFDPAAIESEIEVTCTLLMGLNPESKALKKMRKKRPGGNPDGNDKHPDGTNKNPGGMQSGIPSGSQPNLTKPNLTEEYKTNTSSNSPARDPVDNSGSGGSGFLNDFEGGVFVPSVATVLEIESIAPGWDIVELLKLYRPWAAKLSAPRDEQRAFIGWFKNFTKGKSPR